MDKGKYMFVVTIPPAFEGDLVAVRRQTTATKPTSSSR